MNRLPLLVAVAFAILAETGSLLPGYGGTISSSSGDGRLVAWTVARGEPKALMTEVWTAGKVLRLVAGAGAYRLETADAQPARLDSLAAGAARTARGGDGFEQRGDGGEGGDV